MANGQWPNHPDDQLNQSDHRHQCHHGRFQPCVQYECHERTSTRGTVPVALTRSTCVSFLGMGLWPPHFFFDEFSRQHTPAFYDAYSEHSVVPGTCTCDMSIHLSVIQPHQLPIFISISPVSCLLSPVSNYQVPGN